MSEPHPYCTEHDQPLDWCHHDGNPEQYWRSLKDEVLAIARHHQPRRGDDVEAWLKRYRDGYDKTGHVWYHLDALLEDYRRHADTGTPLDAEVRER